MTGAEIALIAMAVGTGVQAYAQYQAGKSAAAQAKAEAAWHAYNAKVSLREAEAERQAAAFEAQQQKRKGKQIQARLRAAVGKAGVTMEGSPLLVAEDTAAELALENAMIRMTGARRVARWKSQSILDISKASMAKTRAESAERAGILGAGTSLLTGAAQTGYMGYEMGVWGK